LEIPSHYRESLIFFNWPNLVDYSFFLNFINFYQKIFKKKLDEGSKARFTFLKTFGLKKLSSPQKPQISKVSSNKIFSGFSKLSQNYFRQKIKEE
jgi:hypothetical protein